MGARSQTCPTCSGLVSIPAGRRNISLDQVVKVHTESCPGRAKRAKKEEES